MNNINIRFNVRHGIVFTENSEFFIKNKTLTLKKDDVEYQLPVSQLHCFIIGVNVILNDEVVRFIAENNIIIIFTKGLGKPTVICAAISSTQKSYRLIKQAEIVSCKKLSYNSALKLLIRRFGTPPPKRLKSINSLRGWEGSKMKKEYIRIMKKSGIEWNGRQYSNWSETDTINRNISIVNHMLYALCHAGISSLGYHPALGILHSGQSTSLVYDIADALKLEFAIPIAIELTKNFHINEMEAISAYQYIYRRFTELNLFNEIINICEELFDGVTL